MGTGLAEQSQPVASKQDAYFNLHELLWNLKVPLAEENERGHKFKLPSYRLNGTAVCKCSFRIACGCPPWTLRIAIAAVLKGWSPADVMSTKAAKKLLAAFDLVKDANGVRQNEKRGVATAWWVKQLLIMDWMPNESTNKPPPSVSNHTHTAHAPGPHTRSHTHIVTLTSHPPTLLCPLCGRCDPVPWPALGRAAQGLPEAGR